MQKIIFSKIEGGLGNQIFMIFNILSLSVDYDCSYWITMNENEKKRKSFNNYKLFNNINNQEIKNIDYVKYCEKKLTYNKIILEHDKNYELVGYFQSWKYFIHNIEFIKLSLNIDWNVIKNIKEFYSNFDKPILAIHWRLTDYLFFHEHYYNHNLKYYEKALSQYDLSKYQIILFSDDVNHMIELIEPLQLKYILANDHFNNDEEQFYMLMLANVIICSNSTFCLTGNIVSNMFNLTSEQKHTYPLPWFGHKYPEINIDDIFPDDNNITLIHCDQDIFKY